MPDTHPDTHPLNSAPSRAAALIAPPRKRRWPRVLAWSCGGLVALLLLSAGAGVLWLRSAAKAALPQLDGDAHLAGLSAPVLSAPVIVRRDAHGVPHIDAATQDDLFVAQGYVTAQDRLWQMDASRRSANGRAGRNPRPRSHRARQNPARARNPPHRPAHLRPSNP